MKIFQYEGNKNPSRNPYEEKTRETTERVRNIDRGSQMNLIAEPSSKFLDFLKKWWILILIISILIVAGINSLVLFLKKDKEQINDSTTPSDSFSSGIVYEEAKKVFSPSFKISSKEKTLTQLSQKSFQKYESTNLGKESSYSILNKAVYDIYTMNSTSSSNSENIFYTKKYTTVITVNSLCSKVSKNPAEDDCQIERQLNLNTREESNLRRNEEDVEDFIKNAILPICLIEHTDTNLIISLSCPETLGQSYKADIIRAFSNIRPGSIKGFEFDKNYVNTIVEEKDDKIYVTSFDNICQDPNEDPGKTIICNMTKNIITDKEGKLIFSKISNSTKTIIDENNSFSNNFTYIFQNVPKENSESFNEEIFQKNLETLLSLTNSFMKKEIYINNFTELALDLMTEEEPELNKNIRRLREEEGAKHPGVHEEVIFPKTIYDITMDLNLKNDIGLTEDKTAKASCIYDVNKENSIEFSNNMKKIDLYDTLNKFISLSKSGNKIANQLYKDLNEPLLNFMDIINENIKKINDILANKDLSEIFDSTYAISELKALPFDFVAATEKLYSDIKDLEDNLLYEIYNPRKKLEDSISSFLATSHNLIFKIFNNLTELSDALSTDSSKIVGISNYYLNNTDDSYYEIIKNASKILDNYYINEKINISKLVDTVIERFYENAINITEKFQSSLDDISDRLNDGSITIIHGYTEHYQKVISNIYNTKIKAKEIIETVKNKFQGALKLKSNGYFETQEELDKNNQSYGQIGQKARTISYALDNNEFIDKTFDNVMTSFRDKFVELLKNNEISIRDKFPLEENVLGTSLFSGIIDELDNYLKTEKGNVLTFIESENKKYLKSVNDHINNFTSDNGKSLEQIISDLLNEMTDIYLDNLNSAYNDSLYTAFKTIDKIIENNKNLGNEYFLEVKNASSFHKTTGFINKYNTFLDSIQTIYNFVNNNLKINFSNKYKNVITQIRSLLQSIKSNKVLEKYYKQLPSAENHLNSINSLFETFNRHISDSYYNDHFLHLIVNYTKVSTEKLNKIIKDFKDIYDEIDKKALNDILNDYDNERIVRSRYCCKKVFGICVRHCYHINIYYDGKDVNSTNNYLKLSKVNFEEYILNFDNKYKELYSIFSNNVKIYNSLLTSLDKKIEDETKKVSLNGKNNYLENISTKFKSIINEKLGNNLLIASYNYFKNKITTTLTTELNNIIEQWKNAYAQVCDDINSNKDNFKSSVYEFVNLASFHVDIYSQEIVYGYGNSIVEKIKNEFNYTNKYYYNLITSKLNKTFAYILNNMPNNEKPFDAILNMRTNEIKTTYNNLFEELKKLKKEILDKTKQEVTLQVNSNNFFKSNDIISEHITAFTAALGEKISNLDSVVSQIEKEDQSELIAAKFYLENSINGKQIKEHYKNVDKTTFVDLQTDVYEKLLDDICKIDGDELINNIIYTLKKFNETNNHNFKYEKEKYIELLQNKLYEEFGNKDLLIQKINSYYSNGINNCKENSKVKIDEILDSILNKIITHIGNEASRLSNQLTSYSNEFKDIKNRLNNYKSLIYSQFYSTITYVVNDFHEQLLEKFYKNYIESGLNEFEKYIDETNFGTANFMNMSIDLNSIIDKEFKLIITDYKNLTFNQIQYKFQKNIQSLDKLFSFSQMKLKINNAIDNAYNSQLLPILKNKTIYNPGDEGVSNYDLPDSILNDTDNFIKEKISNIRDIIKTMEGEKYIIDNDLVPADFSKGIGNVYDKITRMFQNFSTSYKSLEEKEFIKKVGEYAVDNFKNLMDNFIPSFGVDFFERILKFNEIQKINILYRHLKHSLSQTIIYYVGMAFIHDSIHLPVDIKLKLFNLNDLDLIVKIKNDLIISTINDRLNGYFEETKNFIVKKYIDDILLNEDFDLKFKTNVKEMIKGIISGNIEKYENKYLNMMKEYIKDYFIEEYKITLNEATKDMKEYVEESKIEIKVNLDDIFSLDSNSILSNIQNKLNKTKIAIDNYDKHYATVKLPEETITFLDNFGNNYIANKYKQIKDLLNDKTTELVIKNLEKLSNEYREEYSIEFFKEEINKIDNNITSYYKDFKKILDNYGSIEDKYEKNLDMELANYRRIRLLEETNGGQKMTDVKLNNTFNELKKTSELVKDFIQSLTLFTNFEDNLDKYNNEKNQQYSYSLYNLDKNKEKNTYYDLMIERLNELNQLSSEYYPQAKIFYEIAKEQIIDGIIEINDLINSCEKITIETIKNKYLEIKNQFNKVEDAQNLIKNEIKIIPYESNKTDNYFTVKTIVQNYLIDNSISLDLIFDEGTTTPKIIGKLVNNVKPKKFDIDFYSTVGQSNKLGRKINVTFNNISSYTDIIFDTGLNQANIITNFDFDGYTVKTQYYEEKEEKNKTHTYKGVTYTIIGKKNTYDIDTPEEEKVHNVEPKNITFIENYIY